MAPHRVDATLAVILGNRTMGCLVPVKDFSRTGIGLFCPVKVDNGTSVRVSVSGAGSLPAEGRVVWCGSSAFDQAALPSFPFRLGIEYQPKDDAARENQLLIYEYLLKIVGTPSS